MRHLLLGLFLGVWITMFLDWLERHKMGADIAFYAVSIILVLLLSWRFILKFIALINPELWLKINQLFAPAQYDEEMKGRIAHRKASREAIPKEDSNRD